MSDYPQSMKLFERAAKVIPGGIYGHQTPVLTVPGSFPYYAERAQGCRYWDVDGNEYIDYLCGYGPMILGYGNEKVDEAAARQREKGDCFNHPAALMVELAEQLVSRIPWSDWAVFGKNGSDMTTWSVTLARAHTGKSKIIVAKGAYHGSHAWCVPSHAGILPEDRRHIHSFRWNDLEELEALFARYEGQIAGVLLTPYHHRIFADSEMPVPGFWSGVRGLCDREDALLLFDDVRAGFRLDRACSDSAVGASPDVAAFSKAIANGYALSACVGKAELKVTASKVFLTGSFWNGAVSMAAALACIREMEAVDAVGRMKEMGQRLIDGMSALGQEKDCPVCFSGPPSMPYFHFEGDKSFMMTQRFCVDMCDRGVFMHPSHNWFLSAAHTREDIDLTLEKASEAMDALKRQGVAV